ncbi:DUF3576 domain-containing protein [Paracoccus xiamenensis]|uniref:DUF3576 domain-containing protein n=1 Tax=Paracoccus xiamenensis TaxID=2714901 RepID=UPI00140B6F04|nr:DUF3576 domain-containing protein [Paracoccus xiamenensis]NHF74352.1 DUF3576 domain-containing protein [Paracoccus xiamenensis]
MTRFALRSVAILALCTSLVACSRGGSTPQPNMPQEMLDEQRTRENESSVWDLFSNRQNANNAVAVNKYLWNASLEVLNFLPIQSIDPFTGVIVTGYGTPPGGGRSYRATINVTDPALDARSLKVSLQGSGGGAVAPDTVRAVEDAILTRARQLRMADGRL